MWRNGTYLIRRWTAIFDGRETGPASAIAALIGLCVATGCATPEERYRTLSIFFDDVPLPESMRPPPEPEEPALAQEAAPAVSNQPTFDWVVHDPECDECHASQDIRIAYAETRELCWSCHDEEDFVDDVLHGPFAAGACLQCHSPHKSQYAGLLLRPPTELCEGCHDATTFSELEQHRVVQGDDCIECHSPHSAPAHYLLQERLAVTSGARVPSHGGESGTRP
jgi:predicted CXXCH cytochrome family protein